MILFRRSSETVRKHLNLVKKHLFALEDAISAELLEEDAEGRRLRKAKGSHVLQLLKRAGNRGIAIEKEDLKHITQLVRRRGCIGISFLKGVT